MARYLSKSDFKVAQTCPTKLYYKKSGYPSLDDEDEYLMLLAEGGYMVEKIGKLLFPEGREIGFDGPSEVAARNTLRALTADQVTLFEATLISGQELARVDILIKRGNDFQLVEVKAKSYDGAEDAAAKAAGRPSLFWRKKGAGLVSGWEEYLEDVAFQVLVLRELFPNARVSPFLLMPDKSKTTQIDQLHSLFQIRRIKKPGSKFTRLVVEFSGDVQRLRTDHFLSLVPVGAEVEELLPEVGKAAAEYSASLNPELRKIATPISVVCKNCEYRSSGADARDGYRECWSTLADVNPHLFELYHVGELGGRGGPAANELIARGKVGLFDVPRAKLVKTDGTVGARNRRQITQIDYTRKGVEWMSAALPRILAGFKCPLRFIDFETTAIAVSYHAGMHPYEAVAFQWSCHSLDALGGTLTHSEWINTDDVFPNFQFAESLMECVGTEGAVFMWATHENTVLSTILGQMAERDYRNAALEKWIRGMVKLDALHPGRLVDMNRLTEQHYFHPLMKGRTSIKVVCDALWQTDLSLRAAFPEYVRGEGGRILSPYASLPPLEIAGAMVSVAEGTGAIRAYEAMVYGVERNDPATRQKWRRLLLQYCKLDSLSMYMVWEHWRKMGKAKNEAEANPSPHGLPRARG
jgi:hypothetical protein